MEKTAITREEAERAYIAMRHKQFERTFRIEAVSLCDEDLEKIIATDDEKFVISDRSD